MSNSQSTPVRACELKRYEIRRTDLPLCCPLPTQRVFDAHPRVYLPIEAQGGKALCPYCGAIYILVD